MKAPDIRTLDMIRKIRDRHARRLAGKMPEGIIAFYRAAGRAALEDARQHTKSRRRRAQNHLKKT